MIYLLFAILFVLLVLIIVLGAFIFVQQKQISAIKALADASQTPSSTPATADAVEELTSSDSAGDQATVQYQRQHPEHAVEIIGLTAYQEGVDLGQLGPLLARESAARQYSVLYLDLSLERSGAGPLNCQAEPGQLQTVSEHLAYLTLAQTQDIAQVLQVQKQNFDYIYIALPPLHHSRTAAVLPVVQAYTLAMAPDGQVHPLQDGLEMLQQTVSPSQLFLGFVASAYRAEDPVHEQVVAALQTQYDDLFLGCVADRQQGEVVFERMAAQLTQRRAERALSLAA